VERTGTVCKGVLAASAHAQALPVRRDRLAVGSGERRDSRIAGVQDAVLSAVARKKPDTSKSHGRQIKSATADDAFVMLRR
jgi:hypothetical protein